MRRRIAIFSFTLALSATAATIAPAMTMCPMIYQPVCAVKHHHQKTYSNRCVARGAHARVIHDGECRKS